MSQSVSNMSQSNLNEEEKEQSQQIRMYQLSQSFRLWNEIVERFGLIPSQTSQKEPQNSTEKEHENLIETIENN
jgi:hypothetical protein